MTKKNLNKRVEKNNFSSLLRFNIYIKHYGLEIIQKNIIQKKCLFNILYLDNFFFYKGLKHLLKLPVNNQRTRSNKSTSLKNNIMLQNHKNNLLKKKNSFSLSLKKKLILNQIKYLWILQWRKN